MTESNRGAYPPERPLAFDRYAERPRGGPAPFTLILSLLILIGVGGGVFYLYRGGVRAPGGPPEPVGAPVGDLRIAAPPQPAAPDPAAGLSIYKTDPNAAAAPAFTPPPEQPTPRPRAATAAPSAPVSVLYPVTPAPAAAAPADVSVADAALAKSAPIEPAAPAKHARAATIDSLLADAAPAAKPKHAKELADATTVLKPKPSTELADAKPAAKPKHAAVIADATPDAAPAPGAKQASGAKGFVVQIGAFSSQDQADKSWSSAAGVAPGAMAGKGKRVATVTKNGATLYRTAITGFDSREDAQALCAKLSTAGRTCFVR